MFQIPINLDDLEGKKEPVIEGKRVVSYKIKLRDGDTKSNNEVSSIF